MTGPTDRLVNRLFNRWDCADSPGCAVAVVKDGEVIFRKGYGMANLEYGIPIQPSTPFHVASISKQFTAFAIHLLAVEAKLDIDDDVRDYVPALHDFGKRITVRHLLHHTSGLREQSALLNLAGWRDGDIMTEQDILGLLSRQRDLNFDPGEEESYSNTGYTLLGLIVRRVSGTTLRQFCQSRIFEPLGMNQTRFQDDNSELEPGRAYSYRLVDDAKYRNVPLQGSSAGATGLLSTVDDLTRWERIFWHPPSDMSEAVAAMLQQGVLNSGRKIAFASGLIVGEHRGCKTVEHGGAEGGFRGNFVRFPDLRFAVVLLSNLATFDAPHYARKVADIFLDKVFEPASGAESATDVEFERETLDSYAGDFLLDSGIIFSFCRDGNRLAMASSNFGNRELVATSKTEFVIQGIRAPLRFIPNPPGVPIEAQLHEGSTWKSMQRISQVELSPERLSEYVGRYLSDELLTVYEMFESAGKLVMRFPRGTVELAQIGDDTFIGANLYGKVVFQREAEIQTVRAFRISNGRVRNLIFKRM